MTCLLTKNIIELVNLRMEGDLSSSKIFSRKVRKNQKHAYKGFEWDHVLYFESIAKASPLVN